MEVQNLDKIRLNEEVAAFFKKGINEVDPGAELYVFGSRAFLEKRGGDIDLLILSHQKLDVRLLQQLKYQFWHQFGVQKVDLVNFTFDENTAFKRIALSSAIPL